MFKAWSKNNRMEYRDRSHTFMFIDITKVFDSRGNRNDKRKNGNKSIQ